MGATPVIGTLTQWAGPRRSSRTPPMAPRRCSTPPPRPSPGSYSGPTGFRETRGPVGEARLSTWAQDETLAGLLWDRSEELTGVTVTP